MIGIAGFEKEQDCLVKVTLKDEGGLNIDIKSKLKLLFGELMKNAVIDAVEDMKLQHGDIEVREFGCLDFAIKARVKTAIKRARRNHHEEA
ncbi:MAG: citrate lyase ACP [Thermotaleaceae bacterium]